MLEEREYSIQELLDTLKITKYQWETRREEVLDNLSDACDFELVHLSGRHKSCFKIKEIYGEYQPLLRKNIYSRERKNAMYKNFVVKEIEKGSEGHVEGVLETTANLARKSLDDKEISKLNHAQGTSENYIRPVLKSNLFNKGDKVWARLFSDNHYEAISEEQLAFLTGLFKEANIEKVVDTFSEYQSGNLSKEEAKELIFGEVGHKYCAVMSLFKNKYGFRPIKVSYYSINVVAESEI